MKKNTITLLALIFSSVAFSQVGINTAEPKATFDINAKNSTGTSSIAEGLLIPRVDRQRAQSMTGVVPSTLVYINSIATGTQAGTAANIDAIGYYYFDGSSWIKLNPGSTGNVNLYNANGTITSNRTVSQTDKTLAFTATSVNAFSVDGTTFSVDAANNRVGIGTSAPQNRLDLGTSNGGSDVTAAAGKKLALFNNAQGTDFYGLGINTGRLQFHAGSSATAAPGMVLSTNGNVGIGNTAPGERLSITDVGNANAYQGIASFFANNLTQGVGIGYNGIQSIGSNTNVDLNLNAKGTGNINLQTNGTTGNVGIGTSNPTRKLDVQGSQRLNAAITAATTNDAIDINVGQDAYSYGNRGNNFGIKMRTSSSVHTGDIARINFGDTHATTNGGNRYLSFSVGKTLNELMYMDDVNGGRVGIGTSSPNSNAALEIASTNKGFLPPRLTTAQRDAMTARSAGTIIYNTSSNCMQYWNGAAWRDNCAGTITGLNCSTATFNRTYSDGVAVTAGATAVISYTGGNGGTYVAQTINSTGVTGLTATLAAGSFANGIGNLTLTITGTPSISAGNNVTASFAINIGGRLCTFTVEVAPTTVSCSRYIGSTSGAARYLFGPAGKNNYYECFRYSNNTLVLFNYTCPAGSLWNGGVNGFGSVPIGTPTTGKCVIQ